MEIVINPNYIVNALLFSGIGLVIYLVGFIVADKLTPYQLWKEIVEKQNTAVAIMVGAIAIGIALIIGAAIHS
ncbi:MAG: DUF350 domain-containing protein [Alphaproteobacteria bacterium]|nr:DUF350 domain-containing protein [Alphaproteobacteria bacterium]